MWIRALLVVVLASVGTPCCANDIHHARLALIGDPIDANRNNDGIAWVWTAPGHEPLQIYLRNVVEPNVTQPSSNADEELLLWEISSPSLEKLLIDREKVRLDMLENPILVSERQLRKSIVDKP